MSASFETTVYIVDTSVWIRLYEECYPPEVFPSLYTQLQECARQGRIMSPRQVLVELGDGRHGVSAWVRALQPSIVPKETSVIAKHVGSICSEFPALIKGTSMEADPFVIAHAISSGRVVVTEERRSIHPNSRPRIPAVCDARGVMCIDTLEMLRRLGVKL